MIHTHTDTNTSVASVGSRANCDEPLRVMKAPVIKLAFSIHVLHALYFVQQNDVVPNLSVLILMVAGMLHATHSNEVWGDDKTILVKLQTLHSIHDEVQVKA